VKGVLNAYNHQLYQTLPAISAQPAADVLAQLAGIEDINKVIHLDRHATRREKEDAQVERHAITGFLRPGRRRTRR
jgi:hypothetical protein